MPIPKTDDDGNREGFWRADQVIQPGENLTGTQGRGAEHLSSLRETHLQEIARQVGFDYIRLGSAQSMLTAMLDERRAHYEKTSTDLSWIASLAALLLLAARFSPLKITSLGFRRGGSRFETRPSDAR